MTPTETVSRLRRLADDWRKEEKQLCEHFGNDIVPQSMRARMIKDTQAINAAVEMIERMENQEPVARFNWSKGELEWLRPWNYRTMDMKPLYLAPGAKGEEK